MPNLQLIIRTRGYSPLGLSAYHFSVDAIRPVVGGHEVAHIQVADLFTIPALISWNDQLKRDIVASIADALKDVYDWEDIQDLQEQAWRAMQGIHPPYAASDWKPNQ